MPLGQTTPMVGANQMNPLVMMMLFAMMAKENEKELMPLMLMMMLGLNPVQYAQQTATTLEQLRAQRDEIDKLIKDMEKK